ncbi:outer membrane beta-barrel protein [Flavobacterium sp. UBA6135]|uniref:outer membrane beta-barrel protein n=1 Tax=Flavobacterium sp. UBA6135 TaxID=1946553 RepID=UPI0025B94671|nr:outer membrane beta-barrel protein [Flavobacterium sp. UBA6135]
MKKTIFTLFIALITLAAKAQEEPKKSEVGLNLNAKIGFAKLIQNEMVNLNGSINSGDLLFFYRLPSGTSFSTGIGMMDFNANGVSAGESYALQQTYLRIPLYLNYSLTILEKQLDSKLSTYGGIGIYANSLMKEEIQTVDETFKNKNQGWNAGLGFNLGVRFGVSENINFGIGFESQSDFTKMKKNGAERKMEEINTVNFSFEFKF